MVYSMTGYGKAGRILNGKDISVEIKSVNHRYFEYTGRIPRAISFLDDKIKKELQQVIARGKVEVNLTVKDVRRRDTEIQADLLLAQNYFNALNAISRHLGIENGVDALSLARFEGVLTRVKTEEDSEKLWRDVNSVLHRALSDFMGMRRTEGEKLRQDVLSRLDKLEQLVSRVETRAPQRVEDYTKRLYDKLREILADKQIDDARILTEAAIFADRVAVDEETTRLRSHLSQYRAILAGGEPRGRKLDFLTQELNRETNTIGSKSNDITVTSLVVEMKSEIEKIREQIQNIE